MIDDGLDFVIATGRMLDIALDLIKPLKINRPVISDNGTLIYDPISQSYLKKDLFIYNKTVSTIVKEAQDLDITPLIYTISSNDVDVFHSDINNSMLEKYYIERKGLNRNKYNFDAKYIKWENRNVYFMIFLDESDKLSLLYDKTKNINGIEASFYPMDAKHSCLEIISDKSGKGQAIDYLKELYKPEKVVCFGDNLNDLCMFEKADIKVTTENAIDQVKEVADIVIGHCNDDSVAKYIKENY